MSQPCEDENCKRGSRALCHCCQKNLCLDHLNEHDDLLNSQLNPLADKINEMYDQLTHINVTDIMANIFKQLDQYRKEIHQIVDKYFDEQQQKFRQSIHSKMMKRFDEINHLRATVTKLIKNQETTSDDLKLISLHIRSIRQEINELALRPIEVYRNHFRIDENLVQMEIDFIEKEINITNLQSLLCAINRPSDNSKALASNNRVLLIPYENQLCLMDYTMQIVKDIKWDHGWIWDMCWSSTISRFFIITLNEIFVLDESTMSIEVVQSKYKHSCCACTCSNTSLYVTTNGVNTAICQYDLLPKIELIDQIQPTGLCEQDEVIQDIAYHKETLAFIINNETTHRKRMELRVSSTYEQLWSIQFDAVDQLNNIFRLSLINNNQWMVIDWKSATIYIIKQDGKINSSSTYNAVPYRCCQFGSNILVISSKNTINFHNM